MAEQVPAAAAMSPGLVSIAGGGNDILRPGADPDVLAELFDAAVARLRASGAQVLMFTGFDPVAVPVLRLLRGRIGTYNMHLRGIADAHDCYLVDLWSMRFLRSRGRVVARPAAPDRAVAPAGGAARVRGARRPGHRGLARPAGRGPAACAPVRRRDQGRLAGRPPRGRPLGQGVPGPRGSAAACTAPPRATA